MPDEPLDTPEEPLPSPPPGYHAAIGARGGKRNSPAQQAVRARGYGKLTEDQRAEIARRYEAGEIARILAAEYGVTKHAIYKIARKARAMAAEEAASE